MTSSSPLPGAYVLGLPPDLIGTVSTYLHRVYDDENAGSDVRNLVTALGPARTRTGVSSVSSAGARCGKDMVRSVRYHHLKHDVQFLSYVCDDVLRWDEKEGCALRSKLARGMILNWIEINPGWRRMHHPYGEQTIRGLYVDVILRSIPDGDTEDDVHTDIFTTRSGHVGIRCVLDHLYRDDDESAMCQNVVKNGVDSFAVIAGVDGVDVMNMSFDEVQDLVLRHGPEKRLRLLHEDAYFAFSEPAVAVDLGLVDVLRYLVEERGVDVNSHHNGILFEYQMPLLAHALLQPDPACFEYLMSAKGIVPNPIMDHKFPCSAVFNSSLLHSLRSPDFTNEGELAANMDVKRVEQILRRVPDINYAYDGHCETFLYRVVHRSCSCCYDWNYTRMDLLLAKAFLDAGGNSEGLFLERFPNRRGYRGKMIQLIKAKNRKERENVIVGLETKKKRRKRKRKS